MKGDEFRGIVFGGHLSDSPTEWQLTFNGTQMGSLMFGPHQEGCLLSPPQAMYTLEGSLEWDKFRIGVKLVRNSHSV